MSLREKLLPNGPKKLLALDGGGIRGVITIEVLAAMEEQLRRALGAGPEFVLADYFDYVAGTSTGAIIATSIALGMPVSTIRDMYLESGNEMFEKASLWSRWRFKFKSDKLTNKLKETYGADTTLGSDRLRTLLMVVLKNSVTDSPWPLSNNPNAMFNDPALPDCNLHLPLWEIVRASTAAPVFFPPEEVKIGPRNFIFVDGGVTTYNNPALQLFIMATAEPYRLQWPSGKDKLLLVSVGTGYSPDADANLRVSRLHIFHYMVKIPAALMYASLIQQDMLCRVFGDCRFGDEIDMEIGDLINAAGPAQPKLFTYLRYNAELTRKGLDRLGVSAAVNAKAIRKLDSVEHIPQLQEVGQALAKQVNREHFKGFV